MDLEGVSDGVEELGNNMAEGSLDSADTSDFLSDSKILDIIMNNSQDTIYFKDKDCRFIRNSRAHAMQFGIEDPGELYGKTDFDFFPEAFAQESLEDEKRIMETGVPIIGKLERWEVYDDRDIWFSASKYPIYGRDGEILGTWGTSRDVTSLKLAQDELSRLNSELEIANLKLQKISNQDGLSELWNQRRFYEILEDTIQIYQQKRQFSRETTFCLMLLDIDCFKLINDTYGHPVGDSAIKFVADIIRANTRESDICFRCGGDEFAVILFDTNIESGYKMAERLREKIEGNKFVFNDKVFGLTVSVGIASYKGERNISKLLLKVDNKLYISKKQGKNQVN